jgi:hypothetical protein
LAHMGGIVPLPAKATCLQPFDFINQQK